MPEIDETKKELFEINKAKKEIKRLKSPTFKEWNVKETEDLEAWVVSKPDALGEDLLIIQRQFTQFDKTKEKLDLLAIDKKGSLVIIENKLGDSGKDVVGQAVKYAAHCSNFTKSQIVNIFAQYLKKNKKKGDAETLICEFIEPNVEDIKYADLNKGSSQRIMLVAANFPAEITSTVLWLRSNDIDIQCIKTTPYELDKKKLLTVHKIIPPPEAEDYMIKMASKDIEEKKDNDASKIRKELREKFWIKTLSEFKNRKFNLYENVSPSQNHWCRTGAKISGCAYCLIYNQSEIRVEFLLDRADKTENKNIYDYLYKNHKSKIDKKYSKELIWSRLDTGKSSKIYCSASFDGADEANWEEMIDWLHKNVKKFKAIFSPLIPKVKKNLNL